MSILILIPALAITFLRGYGFTDPLLFLAYLTFITLSGAGIGDALNKLKLRRNAENISRICLRYDQPGKNNK